MKNIIRSTDKAGNQWLLKHFGKYRLTHWLLRHEKRNAAIAVALLILVIIFRAAH